MRAGIRLGVRLADDALERLPPPQARAQSGLGGPQTGRQVQRCAALPWRCKLRGHIGSQSVGRTGRGLRSAKFLTTQQI